MGRKDSSNSGIRIRKIVTVSALWLGVCIFGIVSSKGRKRGETIEISRPSYGEENEVSLTAKTGFGERNIDISILSYLMSEEEVEQNLESFMPALEKVILKENDSLLNITSDIALPDRVEGFPYELEYSITPRGLFDRSGKLVTQVDEPEDFSVEVTVYYDDSEYKRIINARLMNKEQSRDEQFWHQVEEEIKKTNEEDRLSDRVVLPENVNGTSVKWKYKESSKMPEIIVLAILMSVLIIFKNKIESGSNQRKRQEQILRDYPEFAIKYALLIGAGLPNLQTMEKIVSDYRKRNYDAPLYEETALALSEIKSGISQTDALNNLAARCQVREVTQFVSLLNQNIRKGGDRLAGEIKKEAMDSLEKKKEEVRKKAEQAGTKLLLPMILLLIIVFVLIIYPAFGSFSF